MQSFFRLLQGRSFLHEIVIVKAIKRSANLGDELKRSIHFIVSTLHGVIACHPWKVFGAGTKRITTCSTEGMPVRYGKTKMFFHGLLANTLTRVVVFKCKRIVGVLSFEFNGANTFEVFFFSF